MLDDFVGTPGNGTGRCVADDPRGHPFEKPFEKAVLSENHLRGRKNVFVFNLGLGAVRFLNGTKGVLRREFSLVE